MWFRWLATRPWGQPLWERGQHCMRPRPDATRPKPRQKILAPRPRWPRGLNVHVCLCVCVLLVNRHCSLQVTMYHHTTWTAAAAHQTKYKDARRRRRSQPQVHPEHRMSRMLVTLLHLLHFLIKVSQTTSYRFKGAFSSTCNLNVCSLYLCQQNFMLFNYLQF